MDIMFKGISDDQPIALMSVISITSFPDNKSFDLNDFYLEADKTYKIIYKGGCKRVRKRFIESFSNELK